MAYSNLRRCSKREANDLFRKGRITEAQLRRYTSEKRTRSRR